MLKFKKFCALRDFFISLSMVAVSATSKNTAGSSSYGFTTDLVIYGLVGFSILNRG